MENLKALKFLLDEGTISQPEYDRRRNEIIDKITGTSESIYPASLHIRMHHLLTFKELQGKTPVPAGASGASTPIASAPPQPSTPIPASPSADHPESSHSPGSDVISPQVKTTPLPPFRPKARTPIPKDDDFSPHSTPPPTSPKISVPSPLPDTNEDGDSSPEMRELQMPSSPVCAMRLVLFCGLCAFSCLSIQHEFDMPPPPPIASPLPFLNSGTVVLHASDISLCEPTDNHRVRTSAYQHQHDVFVSSHFLSMCTIDASCNTHACTIHACAASCCCTIHACTIHACTIHACTIHACTIHACTIHACTASSCCTLDWGAHSKQGRNSDYDAGR
jgi:hypothetical protein